jgi:hypothetical protein
LPEPARELTHVTGNASIVSRREKRRSLGRMLRSLGAVIFVRYGFIVPMLSYYSLGCS